MIHISPHPAEVADSVLVWLPCHRKSAGSARRQLQTFVAGIDGGELYLQTGELVVTELVTNALLHARVPHDRRIPIRFTLMAGRLRIEVHDTSSAMPIARTATEEDETGRGLRLVEQLSETWGCSLSPDGTGKAVWCLVAPSDPGGTAVRTPLAHDARESAL